MHSTNWSAWWLGRVAIFIVFATAAGAGAAEVLFPEPLHLVRRVTDPISNSTAEIDEFYSGNRVVSVAATRTVIVDHAAQQLVEIERGASTYSVTSFAEIAAARAALPASPGRRLAPESSAAREEWTVRPAGMRSSSSRRSVEWFEIERRGERRQERFEIGVDQQITLSREALDVVTGGSFPNEASGSDQIARACRRADAGAGEMAGDKYGLPLEQVIALGEADEKKIEVRNSIVRIDHELPSPDVYAIPAGARLVPSRRIVMPRLIKEFDNGTFMPNRP